jgi:dephospho-CoA kinase
MKKIIIGVVGEKGAGKATFTNILTEVTAGRFTVGTEVFSGILYETLRLWDIPTTRSNLQNLSIIMRNQYGPDVLTHAIQQRVKNKSEDIIILDGVRWQADYDLIRSFEFNFLVYVSADPKIRWERLQKGSLKVGERQASWEQFLEEEKAETEIQIPEIGAKADFKIDNNKLIEDYRKQVKSFFDKLLSHDPNTY